MAVVAVAMVGIAAATVGLPCDDRRGNAAPAVSPTATPHPATAIAGGLDAVIERTDAVADLDVAATAVRDRHPACVAGCPDRFEQSVREERAALPVRPTMLDVRQAVARSLSAMDDAHTAAVPPRPSAQAAVDLALVDGRVLCTTDLCTGQEVATVEGVAVGELRERNRALVAHERVTLPDHRLAVSLTRREDLRMLDVDPGEALDVTWADGGGTTFPFGTVRWPPSAPAVAWTVDPSGTTAVLTLGSCVADQAYRDALAAMFDTVHSRGLRGVVVDVRDNPGGDSGVADELARYLAVDTFRVFSRADVREGDTVQTYVGEPQPVDHVVGQPYEGQLVVLTDGATASSAINLAAALQDQGLARVVGEPPDGMPSAYGDIVTTRLPSSGIEVSVSTKKFVRVDDEAEDEPLTPDLEVPGDQALDAAIHLIGS